MPDFLVRNARVDDVDAIIGVCKTKGVAHFATNDLAKMLTSQAHQCWVAERDTVIGYLLQSCDGSSAHALQLYTTETERSDLVCGSLVSHSANWIKQQYPKINAVDFECPINSPFPLWVQEKYKARTLQVKQKYYPDGSDALLMSIDLINVG